MRYYSNHVNDQFDNFKIVLGDCNRAPCNPTDIRARNYRYRAHQALARTPQSTQATGDEKCASYTLTGDYSPSVSDVLFEATIENVSGCGDLESQGTDFPSF